MAVGPDPTGPRPGAARPGNDQLQYRAGRPPRMATRAGNRSPHRCTHADSSRYSRRLEQMHWWTVPGRPGEADHPTRKLLVHWTGAGRTMPVAARRRSINAANAAESPRLTDK
jgi:hypothetical protein